MKKLIEDAYIVGATVASILAWGGLETMLSKLALQNKTSVQGMDVTGLTLSTTAFLGLAALNASRAIVDKGVEFDGVKPGGEGVAFCPKYLHVEL